MMPELVSVLLVSILIDRFLGEPPDSVHPTVWMGKTITFVERRFTSGILVVLIVPWVYSIASYLLVSSLDGPLRIFIAGLIFKTSYSWRGLKDYTIPLAKFLGAGDLQAARKHIPYIAGRDPGGLDADGMISTSLESIAEGSVDGVVSPFFYFLLFSFTGMEAAVSASVFYRAVNTIDSMIGRPENPEGYIPAKVDELVNFIPARLGGLLLLTSGALLGKDVNRGLSTFIRERNTTKSKNAGQTMSALAGLLGVRLDKKGSYVIGVEKNKLRIGHIYESLKIVDVQITVLVFVMVIYWIF